MRLRRTRRDHPREARADVVHNSFLFQAALSDVKRLSRENEDLQAEVRRLRALLGFPHPDATAVRS